jgi:hypothetical protein
MAHLLNHYELIHLTCQEKYENYFVFTFLG